MISTVLKDLAQGNGALVGGLDWRVIPSNGKVDAQVRTLAGQLSASHAVRAVPARTAEVGGGRNASGNSHIAVGFYVNFDGSKIPKNAHSLAAAFASWTREHPRALLCIKVKDKWAVVVVVGGAPVLDKVEETSAKAYELCKSYLLDGKPVSVFSDDLGRYPDALDHEDLLAKITGALSADTLLKPIPPNVVMLAMATLLICALVGGGYTYYKVQQEKKRQAELQRLRDADPVPKYLNALAAAREAVGVDRASMKAGIEAAMRTPLSPEGWNASRISCMQASSCEVVFTRTTGTFKRLQADVAHLTISPASAINLNEARMSWSQPTVATRLDPANQLPPMNAFVQGPEASKLQDWLVAGLTIQVTPPRLWPQAEGVPDSFKHPQALAAGKFEIDSIAIPQMLEAVANAPANVVWTGWVIDVGDAKQQPLSRAKGRLTGTFYVTNSH